MAKEGRKDRNGWRLDNLKIFLIFLCSSDESIFSSEKAGRDGIRIRGFDG